MKKTSLRRPQRVESLRGGDFTVLLKVALQKNRAPSSRRSVTWTRLMVLRMCSHSWLAQNVETLPLSYDFMRVNILFGVLSSLNIHHVRLGACVLLQPSRLHLLHESPGIDQRWISTWYCVLSSCCVCTCSSMHTYHLEKSHRQHYSDSDRNTMLGWLRTTVQIAAQAEGDGASRHDPGELLSALRTCGCRVVVTHPWKFQWTAASRYQCLCCS